MWSKSTRRRKPPPIATTMLGALFFVLLSSAEAQLVRGRPPSYKETNTYDGSVTVREGSMLALNCPFRGSDMNVEWFQDGRPRTDSTSPKARLLRRPSATRDDAGIWRCVANNAFGTALAPAHNVSVVYLDDFDAGDDTLYSVATTADDAFILRRPPLIAGPNANATFTWFKGDSEVSADASHYLTNSGDLVVWPARGCFGDYRVIARLSDSDDESSATSLTYTVTETESGDEAAFRIVVGPASQDLLVDIHGNAYASFDCVTNMWSDTKIRWFMDGKELVGDGHRTRLSLSNRRLEIRDVTEIGTKKRVTIECKAYARSGRLFETSSALVRIMRAPRLVPLPSETGRQLEEKFELDCQLEGDVEGEESEGTDIRWYHNAKPILTEGGHLAIESVTHDDFGIYQCEASNRAGRDLATVWLRDAVGWLLCKSEDIPRSRFQRRTASTD